VRDGLVVYEGAMDSLKRFKDDAREVRAGQDCGIKIHGYDDVKVGDRLEAFETVEIQRTLA
jgi:translation initiation factor IF-2